MLSIHSSPIGRLGTRDTGGMSVYVRELAKALGYRGHCIDIFTAVHDNQHQPAMELCPNVRLIHLQIPEGILINSTSLYSNLQNLFEALEAYRTGSHIDYDLIHSHYWLSGIVGIRAQKHWNRPHIITFHTVAAIKNRFPSGEKEPDIRLSHEKKLTEACNYIVCSSQQEREFFIHHFHVPPEKIGSIACGVNLDRFRPMDKEKARRQLALDEKKTILLYVGRFVPIKGLDRLIQAMTYVKDPSVHLLVVGGDGVESTAHKDLINTIDKLNLQETITFAGRVDQKDLPLYYNSADFLVLPSYHESFGLVALESLACGIPVLATRVGAAESIIKEGIGGLLIDGADPQSLSGHIVKALSRNRSQSVSQNQIRETVKHLTWGNAASELLKIYQDQVTRF